MSYLFLMALASFTGCSPEPSPPAKSGVPKFSIPRGEVPTEITNTPPPSKETQ